jgi:hypothetical protein
MLEAGERIRTLPLTGLQSVYERRQRAARCDGLCQPADLLGEPLGLAGEP